MAFFQWRRFNFFDISKECDNGALAASLQVMYYITDLLEYQFKCNYQIYLRILIR